MTFIASLSTDDLTRYLNLVREAIKIRRHFDLLCWLQGPVQRFLPHQILIAAWGDFGLGLIHHDIVSNLPGVRTQFSDAETLRRLLCGLYDRWVDTEKAPYIIGVHDSGFSLNDSSLQCALGSALKGMRNAIVHGIRDVSGRHDCLYVMFSSDNARDSQGRSAVAYLLPYLDAAMRQVAHPPAQKSVAGVSDESVDPGSEFGLSEREIQIMEWVRMGKTNIEVAMILDISSFTVKNHLQRIFKKLGVFNRMQAVARFEQGKLNA